MSLVLVKLGDIGNAVTAIFPDESTIKIPYGNLDQAFAALLFGIHYSRLTPILEKPITVLAAKSQNAETQLKERLETAYTLRYAIEFSGIPYIEVQGSLHKVKPKNKQIRKLAEKYRTLVTEKLEETAQMTGEIGEELIRQKHAVLLNAYPRIYATALSIAISYSTLLLIPVIFTFRKAKHVARLGKTFNKEEARLLASALMQTPLSKFSHRLAALCTLYSPEDMTNSFLTNLIKALLITARSIPEKTEEQILEKPIIAVYGNIQKEYKILRPKHKPAKKGGETRVALLPILHDERRATQKELDNFDQTTQKITPNDMTPLNKALQKILKLPYPPEAQPPINAEKLPNILQAIKTLGQLL